MKSHFRLISQERYEEVLEKVFDDVDYEECNEDQCIVMIQEMLQVENVFHLQVLGEGDDTQLSLSWRTLDEKRKEEEFCERCRTGELRKMIGGLVENLVGKSVVEKSEKGFLFFKKVNGVWYWVDYGNEKTDIRYEGEISNGLPNGQGTRTHPNGGIYEGEWKDGKRDGHGTQKYGGKWKGEKYVGNFKEDRQDGQGTYMWSDGTKYIGEFKMGELWNGYEYEKSGRIIVKWMNGKYIKQ